MAAQAVMIADTIAGMKRVIHGHRECSPSLVDRSPPTTTNRGQKLKRRAQFIHEDHLSGERIYKRKIEHAGFTRFTLNRNPRRYDEFGEELEDDEVDEKADTEAAEENPYGDIRLQDLLMPLTAVTELSNHPSMSFPYKSTVLHDMVQQTCEIVHKERKTLCTMKKLLTKFRGDSSWVPCGELVSENDTSLFVINTIRSEHVTSLVPRQPKDQNCAEKDITRRDTINTTINGKNREQYGSSLRALEGEKLGGHERKGLGGLEALSDKNTPDVPETAIALTIAQSEVIVGKMTRMATVTALCEEENAVSVDHETQTAMLNTSHNTSEVPASAVSGEVKTELQIIRDDPSMEVAATEPTELPQEVPLANGEDEVEDVQAPAHRMTTRAQAQAVSDNTVSSHTRSPSPNQSDPSYIHSLYLVSHAVISDRNLGLPTLEAEETCRILMMWVQKQEEVVRGMERLYEGLLKADRMRKTVFKWCKAEGHTGEMSDGEDWYDKDEWNLEESLKKGQLEEEDDTANQGKKTRGRRVAQ